jgi:hypothetical protein
MPDDDVSSSPTWDAFLAEHPELGASRNRTVTRVRSVGRAPEVVRLDLASIDDDAIVAAVAEAERQWQERFAERNPGRPVPAWAGKRSTARREFDPAPGPSQAARSSRCGLVARFRHLPIRLRFRMGAGWPILEEAT